MILTLRDDFARAWEGSDAFAQVDALEGTVYRNVKSRRTLRFEFEGNYYFAKAHHGVGWGEIIKNLITLKQPVLDAGNEWCAIRHLHDLGVRTMTAVGFGCRGINPATRHSFILTESLEDTISLEDYCAQWTKQRPVFSRKLRLLNAVAAISRAMHGAGMCHRDFYLCHFLLHEQECFEADRLTEPTLSLIDLHRALIHKQLPKRWIVKDVAGLYFSALHIGLTRQDFLRFARIYSGKSLRQTLTEDKDFWRQVHSKAMALDQKINQQVST